MNDYSYELKQVGFMSIGVGTFFFLLMSRLGGNAALSRYLAKDTATVHDTKFKALVSHSNTYFNVDHSMAVRVFSVIIMIMIMYL